jgi:hypothetical protein
MWSSTSTPTQAFKVWGSIKPRDIITLVQWLCVQAIQGEPGMWGGLVYRGLLRDECRRALVEGHLSARDSMKGTLGEGSCTVEPER